MQENKFVSVIIPVYNEQRYIEGLIKSLTEQTYPLDKMEWIFVDGESKDDTVKILKDYQEKYPNLPIYISKDDLFHCENFKTIFFRKT